jgi:protein-S-isoprenylcysteine O-methyltransferase Ste14
MIPVPLHFALVLLIASPFLYFITAGAKTFTVPELRDGGATLGQTSFISGAFGVLGVGLFHRPELFHELCGSGLALCSVLLYEWTRHTVLGKTFYTGLGGEVPETICEQGPYKYVRHPFYMSYMTAFLGMLTAFPTLVTGTLCVLNIGLFVYIAFDDERVLARSRLAADYRGYKTRAGMFMPRVGRMITTGRH